MKKNIIIVLLILALLSFGSYFAYDKFLKEEHVEEKTDTTNKKEEQKNEGIKREENNQINTVTKIEDFPIKGDETGVDLKEGNGLLSDSEMHTNFNNLKKQFKNHNITYNCTKYGNSWADDETKEDIENGYCHAYSVTINEIWEIKKEYSFSSCMKEEYYLTDKYLIKGTFNNCVEPSPGQLIIYDIKSKKEILTVKNVVKVIGETKTNSVVPKIVNNNLYFVYNPNYEYDFMDWDATEEDGSNRIFAYIHLNNDVLKIEKIQEFND